MLKVEVRLDKNDRYEAHIDFRIIPPLGSIGGGYFTVWTYGKTEQEVRAKIAEIIKAFTQKLGNVKGMAS